MLEQAAQQFAQSIPYGLIGVLLVGLILFAIIASTPIGLVFNILTVPLGYEFQTCPYCPAFHIKKITKTECANCGESITENFSMGRSPAGDSEMYHFCERECKTEWSES